MIAMSIQWLLKWPHGTATLNSLGGMVGPVEFVLPDERQVRPFSMFPWHNEPLGPGESERSPLLAGARGDWFCAPFGIARPDDSSLDGTWKSVFKPEAKQRAHGAAAHGQWRIAERGEDFIEVVFDGFAQGPLKSVRRRLTADRSAPRIRCDIQVDVSESCRLPMGLHPTFRLPMTPGSLHLKPGAFRFGMTFPGTFEQASPLFASGQRFSQLAAVPARDGGIVDATRLPFSRPADDIVQLCAIDGSFRVENHEEGYATTLEWDAEKLPSCIVWICSGGRLRVPWGGRYFAVGIDPICSAFDLGQSISSGENPMSEMGVRTAVELEPAKPWKTTYTVGVSPTG
jgi:hypothetical protein